MLASGQNVHRLTYDNAYDGSPDWQRVDVQTKDECKKGGWATYGFRNQGLCIQFVNTGRDSRVQN